MKNKNVLWSYLAIVFILSYFFQLIIYFTGGVNSFQVPFMMLFPAIVARENLSFSKMDWSRFKNPSYSRQ